MKTLIICSDGTWNQPDQRRGPTNVTKLARGICPENDRGEVQIVYYDEGVGTGNWWDRWLGGMMGIGLARNVQQAYRFLCLNYLPGDCIVLVGFSRGAFTVRSLAGLVGLVGLLRKGDLDKMPAIWGYYRTPPDRRDPAKIDRAWIAREPDIDLLVVWDTVGSMGVPIGLFRWIGQSKYKFHNVSISPKIKRAYQALAVDEHRRNFRPAIWDTKNGLAPNQVVEQRWFAGAHSNVGGGYENAVLSDIALRWIKSKVTDVVKFDDEFFTRKINELKLNEARGVLVNSCGFPWVLLGRIHRTIGTDPTESVDDSVLWRRDASKPFQFSPGPYAPRNLKAYFDARTAPSPGG
jgi:uncharacterized protein (DUF2235 family)